MAKPCGVEIATGPCEYPRKFGKQKCQWHWMLGQPVDVQIKQAEYRLLLSDGLPRRARVKKEEWPEGERWCADCQSFIPAFYVQGSRCYACESRAKHASMVQNTYQLPAVDYDRLLAWQGGRCYVCRQVPRVRRLAVDHDHKTNKVRGLLCANNEWGCNVLLARMLNDIDGAKRLVAYLEKYPYDRMKSGEEGVYIKPASNAVLDSLKVAVEHRKAGTYEEYTKSLQAESGEDPFGENPPPKEVKTDIAPASNAEDGGDWGGWNF